MKSYTFTEQTGYFNYQLDLNPAYTTGSFGINFFNSGLAPTTRFHISGISGKIFDTDNNFIHSYYLVRNLFKTKLKSETLRKWISIS